MSGLLRGMVARKWIYLLVSISLFGLLIQHGRERGGWERKVGGEVGEVIGPWTQIGLHSTFSRAEIEWIFFRLLKGKFGHHSTLYRAEIECIFFQLVSS